MILDLYDSIVSLNGLKDRRFRVIFFNDFNVRMECLQFSLCMQPNLFLSWPAILHMRNLCSG